MGRIDVRNIDDAVVVKLESMAKERGISREKFCRIQLEDLAIAGEIKAVENKYENLVKVISDAIKSNTEEIEIVKLMLEKILEKL